MLTIFVLRVFNLTVNKVIDDLIIKLENALIRFNPDAFGNLANGLPIQQIEAELQALGVNDRNIAKLFHWKNGYKLEKYVVATDEIISFGKLMSLERAILLYHEYAIQRNIWQKTLFPIIEEGGGVFILYDFGVHSDKYEMLHLYAPTLILSEQTETVFDSLESFISTIIECYEKGAYHSDSNNNIDINYDLEWEISRNLNPLSEYWQNVNI